MTSNLSMDGSNGGGEPHPAATSRTELYIVMGLLSFLSIMGTAGNALVLYVFTKKKDRLTSTLFILVLAFVDLVTCLFVVPYTMYMESVDFHISYDIVCKIYQFLITSNIPFSALIMVAIAIDRYFCICHPFLHAITVIRAKIMIAGLAIFAVGLGVIVALMYGVYGDPHEHSNNTTLTYSQMNSGNVSINGSTSLLPIYTGECKPNTLYLSNNFRLYYQRAYTAMYLVCLIIVIVLYVLIYKSVLTRRTKRQKQKSKSLPMVMTSTQPDNNGNSQEETMLTTVNGEAQDVKNGNSANQASGVTTALLVPTPAATATTLTPAGPMTTVVKPKSKEKKKDDKERRKSTKSTKKDKNRIANLKTAAMLFVVTVVFIVTFLPAFLMALTLIPYNMTVFYMYFANNVANPVIYSFMNKNFRDDLKKLFCRR